MKAVKISDRDNVAVVVAATAKGDIIEGTDIRALSDIPQGHKIALQPIKKDQPVIRYGVVLGYRKEDIPAGGWINENNLAGLHAQGRKEGQVPGRPSRAQDMDGL